MEKVKKFYPLVKKEVKKHSIYLSDETRKLLRVIGGGKYGEAVTMVIKDFLKHGGGEAIDYPRSGRMAISVDDVTWRVCNRVKVELEYKKVDDLVFDAAVGYLIRRGVDSHCIVQLLNL